MWGVGSWVVIRYNGFVFLSFKLLGLFYFSERRMKFLKMGNYDIFFLLLLGTLNFNYFIYFGGVFKRRLCYC